MATYFHGSSEIEAADNGGGLHKLYILNPNFIPNYSTTTQDAAAAAAAANTLILNPMGNGVSPSMVQPHHAPSPNQHHHFVGIPLSTGAMTFGPNHGSVDDPSHPSSPHGFSLTTSLHDMDPRPQSYPCGRQLPDPSLSSDHLLQVGEPSSSGAAFLPSWQQRGLSLSLSTEHQPQRPSFTPRNSSSSSVPKSALGVLQPHPIQTIPGSKYLRAVQELLDEVVNVEKDTRNTYSGIDGDKMKSNVESSKDVASSSGGDHERSDHHVKGSGAGGDGDHPLVGTAQRQELQMKKTKLMNMLDEVEHRYKQYHHQMQLVVSSFERATSVGAAKSYTSLALKTISRQFRCLKDVLVAQIKATSKSLGDDDCLGKKLEGSRLKYVDNHLRQQRALQQLGMIHHNNNAWRPQRGLPERAVTVLRAWLFEHFLHPYPKDSDKHMLAKQTGLTRSQVSNWFINARVRLWKPMVEEMYLEETKSQEQTGSKDDTISKTTMEPDKGLGSTTIPQDDGAFRSMNLTRAFQSSQASGITMIELSDPEEIGIAQTSPKRLRINSSNIRDSPSGIVISKDTDMPMRDMNREVGNQCSVLDAFSQENVTSFNADIGGRSYGSGVSLTLGLQHFAKPSLSSPTPQHFMPNVQTMNHHLGRRFLGVNNAETADFFSGINAGQEQSQPTSSTNYEAIDIDNRKRFVAAQLLPDYVAL